MSGRDPRGGYPSSDTPMTSLPKIAVPTDEPRDDLREEIAQATFKAVVEREESWVAGQPAPPWERQTEYVHNLYRVIADAALATDGIQRLINGVAAVRKEIEEEERYHADLPSWEIGILVSTDTPRETREAVFEAVADAACNAMGEGHEDCPFVSADES